ncbi:adenosylcobinamide-phosphate synthase CbiB [Calorimonas adulescens]|uniref:Cobalamin biosynthesis protein CobD n=1 Tax=Calorimonas adulescens TaxID=2606906 RepID=A0A5D8Q8T8_9THEO|nr:adenosylcobinamide-phosphate synthase CbiB [Calorimonas adulescens]TZE80902.1 cobalamin biosynthesis protein CobD [Calorimonas adulescens]
MVDVVIAFVLDFILGDPAFLLHPVRLIGRLINVVEGVLYPVKLPKRLTGLVLLAVTAFTAWIIPYSILKVLSPYRLLYHIVDILMIFFCLSLRDLGNEAMRVYHSLMDNDVVMARKNLSMIVGRDTDCLNENEIIRAAVETVAENIVDGFISPLFYIILFGAPAGLAFKAVSTLDSMVGYKNERYMDFGWASARTDDLLNFLPARLSLFLIPTAALFIGMDFNKSLSVGMRDRLKNPSPNSGHGEACFAGAMGIKLGGLNYYNGVPSKKPIIGGKRQELEREDIRNAVHLAYATGFVTMIIFCGVRYLYAGAWW